jgi:chromosomal replication initiation ATPase DnaA
VTQTESTIEELQCRIAELSRIVALQDEADALAVQSKFGKSRGGEIVAVVRLVSEATGIPTRDILGTKRSWEVAEARHKVCFLLRKLLKDMSLTAIATAINRIDHATVVFAVRKIEGRMASSAEFSRGMRELMQKCVLFLSENHPRSLKEAA